MRTDGQTDRQASRQTDRHEEINGRFSQSKEPKNIHVYV